MLSMTGQWEKSVDQGGCFFDGMAFADEIDVEFLQHLHADGGEPGLKPCLLDEGLGDVALFRSIKIVAVKQDIRIQKTVQRAWA